MGKRRTDPMAGYDTMADTVGGIPNLRLKDNVFQLVCTLAGIVLGAIGGAVLVLAMGWEMPWWMGALIGGVLGFIGGAFLSGLVLMVVGWVRAAKGE